MEKKTIQQTRLENSRVYQSSHESENTPSKKGRTPDTHFW